MNHITEKFRDTLDYDKELHRVHADIQPKPPRKITIFYKDGTDDSFYVDMPHQEFMKEWKGFYRWFDSFRKSDVTDQ